MSREAIPLPAPEPVPETDWARLVAVSTRYAEEEFPLRESVVIVGRGDDAQLRIDTKGLSRHHAVIRYNPRSRAFFVLDNGSKNGTFLNKKKVVSHDLADGDVVQFHTESFRFEWLGPRQANLDGI